MPFQSIYFSKFPGGACSRPPSTGKLCMLIVFYALTSLATHNQKLYFISVTMPDLENRLETAYGHDVF